MKKNGQALVEFIIILPILVVLFMGIIDFSLIYFKKNTLENNLDEVVEIWKDNKSITLINEYLDKQDSNIEVLVNEENNTTTIQLVSDYNPVTPGLNIILNDYEMKVKRVIYNG